MKSLFIATLLAASTFAVSAQSNNGETYGQTGTVVGVSTSRANVTAQALAAQASGTFARGEFSLADVSAPLAASRLTRDQVLQEAIKERQLGALPANGESSGA